MLAANQSQRGWRISRICSFQKNSVLDLFLCKPSLAMCACLCGPLEFFDFGWVQCKHSEQSGSWTFVDEWYKGLIPIHIDEMAPPVAVRIYGRLCIEAIGELSNWGQNIAHTYDLFAD